MKANDLGRLLEAHPRVAGALITVSLLLMQAGSTVASCCVKTGP